MTTAAGVPPGALGRARFVGFVPVRDLAVARDFYVGVLGLALQGEDDFAVTVDAAGATLRLTQVVDLRPEPFTIAGWVVDDLEHTVGALAGSGVAFRRYEGLDQDSQGIWAAPGGDLVAWFSDPDGNTLSLTGRARA